MEKINVVFMGTPDFSLNVLKMLIEVKMRGCEIFWKYLACLNVL